MTRRQDADAFQDAWEALRVGRDVRVPEAVRDVVETAELIVARAAEVAPRPDFSADLRARLMAEAADVLVPQKHASTAPAARAARDAAPHPVRRRLGGLAAAAVASLGCVGLVTASASAVPGDALYPIKQGVESIQQSMRSGQVSEGEYQLERAGERLREAQQLAQDGVGVDDQRMVDLLETFSSQADDGSEDLLDAWSTDESTATLQSLGTFTMRAGRDLASLGQTVDAPQGSAPLDRAASTISDLATQVGSLCHSCVDLDGLNDSLGLVSSPSDQTVRSDGSARQTTQQRQATSSTGSRTSTSRSTTSRTPAASGGSSSASRSTPAPQPSASSDPVGGLVDPVVGGLLGDDDEPGLVPGLTGPLLGSK